MLPTASLTIAEIFGGPFLLNVPVYQRPYSWGRDQAGQLLEDLIEASGLDDPSGAPDSDYFLGYMLLMDPSGLATARFSPRLPAREFDIVDGQQRLVTLMTLLAVLRDLSGNPRSALVKRTDGMIVAQQGSRFFKSERFRLHLSSRDRPFFERHVLQAKSTLAAPAADAALLPDDGLQDVRDQFVAELKDRSEAFRASLFAYVVDRCHVVVILSDDIDRAHRMFVVLNERGKKLQRNDILKADVLSGLPGDKIEWAVREWDKASGKLNDKDFEDFFGYVRSIFGYTRPQIISGVRAVVRDFGGAESFLNKVFLPLAASFSAIRLVDDEALPPEFRRHLRHLNRLPGGDWVPAAMMVLRDWQNNPELALAQLAAIDRFGHLLRLLCLGNGKRQSRFASVVAALRANAALKPDDSVFQLSREEVRNIAYHLKDLHHRNPKMCKLLLLRLNEEGDAAAVVANPEKYTIEHVLPQRPSATSEWRRWYPSAEERSRCTESLGNLVLISEKQNDKARNASFAAKKDIYAKPDPAALLLAATGEVVASAEWHRFEIEAREEQMLKQIEEMWSIDLGTARQTGRDSKSAEPASVRAAARN